VMLSNSMGQTIALPIVWLLPKRTRTATAPRHQRAAATPPSHRYGGLAGIEQQRADYLVHALGPDEANQLPASTCSIRPPAGSSQRQQPSKSEPGMGDRFSHDHEHASDGPLDRGPVAADPDADPLSMTCCRSRGSRRAVAGHPVFGRRRCTPKPILRYTVGKSIVSED